MHFDTQNTAREVIGFKLEKELDVGECDIIDGFMVSEFCIGFQCSIQIEFLLLSKDSRPRMPWNNLLPLGQLKRHENSPLV
jgi:hypothetical protein